VNYQAHQQQLEAYYQKQIGGRTVFWKDKYKPYLSLYRDRLLKRNAAIEAALPATMERALDLGCGQGDLLVMLSARATSVTGIDYAEVMVQTARENLSGIPNVEVLCAPGEILPLPDHHVDAVVLADVIEHLVDPPQCLRECRRVLKPGGRLVITTPNAAMEFFWKRFDGFINAPFRWLRRNKKPIPPVLEHLYRRDELVTLVLAGGFRVRDHQLIEFYPGSEGAGVFGRLLRLIARQKQIREWVVEPWFRFWFGAIERLKVFNNRQLLVLEKPAG